MITVKICTQEATRGHRRELEFFQSLIPRELLFDLSGGSLEDPACKAAFICSDSELI